MTYEEFETAAKEILADHLDGKTSEKIPDFLESARTDYKQFESGNAGEVEEANRKYEELKKKYVERFFDGESGSGVKDDGEDNPDDMGHKTADDKITVEDIMG